MPLDVLSDLDPYSERVMHAFERVGPSVVHVVLNLLRRAEQREVVVMAAEGQSGDHDGAHHEAARDMPAVPAIM